MGINEFIEDVPMEEAIEDVRTTIRKLKKELTTNRQHNLLSTLSIGFGIVEMRYRFEKRASHNRSYKKGDEK